MSTRVLELNDTRVSLSDGGGLICSSPAYVLDDNGSVVFGEQAAARSRLFPLQCNNVFWYRLNMELLPRPLANFRHHADIAHAHLLHLAEVAEAAEVSDINSDVVIAVPGSLTREQLAILTGVTRHTPFNVVGLIDAATAAATAVHQTEQHKGTGSPTPVTLYLDLHLHQMVISRLTADGPTSGARIERQQLITLPELGWIPLSNSLVQLATDAFIRQSRFNPRDNALWEQTLYDQLPGWLAQVAGHENNLLLEISTDKARYQAKLTADGIRGRLQPAYQKLVQHIQSLAGGESCTVLISERCAALPGLVDILSGSTPESVEVSGSPVADQAVVDICLGHADQFIDAGGSLRFVTVLTSGNRSAAAEPATDESRAQIQPTHLLHENRARRLNGGLALLRGESGELLTTEPGVDPDIGDDATVLGKITVNNGQIHLQCEQSGLMVNGLPVQGERTLSLGDRIGTENTINGLRLIQVHDG